MAPSAPPGPSPVRRAVAAVLLIIGIVGTLVVPIYARSTPKLGAFPFFYWYLLLAVPVTAILCGLCFLLLRTSPAPSPDPANGGGAPS
jgi:Protein of unknown function (DUF3311)